MEKGGHKPEWQLKIDNTYQDWKYNDVHKNIKSYFNEAHSKKHHSKTLKEQVEESSPISNDLSSLHDNVKNEEEGGKENQGICGVGQGSCCAYCAYGYCQCFSYQPGGSACGPGFP